MHQQDNLKLIYPAFSKHSFYFRMHISKFVLEQKCLPLNPFMIWEYFLLDTVDRDLIRQANNTLVKKCDELWVFGPVSDGVLAEIKIAKTMKKPLRFFNIRNSKSIEEITKSKVEYESEIPPKDRHF